MVSLMSTSPTVADHTMGSAAVGAPYVSLKSKDGISELCVGRKGSRCKGEISSTASAVRRSDVATGLIPAWDVAATGPTRNEITLTTENVGPTGSFTLVVTIKVADTPK